MINKNIYEKEIKKIQKQYPEYDYNLEFVIKNNISKNNIPKGMSKKDIPSNELIEIGLTVTHKGNPFQIKCYIVSPNKPIDEWSLYIKNEICEFLRKKRGV